MAREKVGGLQDEKPLDKPWPENYFGGTTGSLPLSYCIQKIENIPGIRGIR
jgi:hypothetical protein